MLETQPEKKRGDKFTAFNAILWEFKNYGKRMPKSNPFCDTNFEGLYIQKLLFIEI